MNINENYWPTFFTWQ